MPDPRFFQLQEPRKRQVGFFEAGAREFLPWTPVVPADAEDPGFFSTGTAGTVAGGALQWKAAQALLTRVLGAAPHPAAKVASIALPILLGALSGAKYREEATPEERLSLAGLGAASGTLFTPLPGKALRRIRGIKEPPAPPVYGPLEAKVREITGEAPLAPGAGLSFPGGSTMAQVWRAVLEGQPRARGGALARLEEGPGAGAMERARRALGELPAVPRGRKAPPALMRPPIRGFPPGTMGEPTVLPGLEPPSPFERALYGEFPRRAVRGAGGPAVSRGTQYDVYLSQRTKPGGPLVHSEDYGRWQQWKKARGQGKGPIAEWPEEAVREAEVRVAYNGERLQEVMAHITSRVARGGARAPVPPIDPSVALAQEITASPSLPDALGKHPFYPTLRQIVSQAFAPRLENPALALGQADTFLAQMVVGRGDAEIVKAVGYVKQQQKRMSGVSPDEVFATIMRGFGKIPKTAATGRTGVRARAAQAALAEGQAERVVSPTRTIGDLLSEWTDPQVWAPALAKMGIEADTFSTMGLLSLLGKDPEALKQPTSMLPRLFAKITAEVPVPLANALDRPGLERFLGYLFQERITPQMLRGLPDESLRAALRSSEAMLSEGHTIQAAADMAALHLGAPNASRLLLSPGREAWKSAVLTGDVAPVFLKALTGAFGRFGLTDKDIMRLAESLAVSEGTSVENALGYLAYKARLPVESIENKVAQQYLRQLQRQTVTDPAIAQVFQELEQDLPGISERTRKGIQTVREGAGVRPGEAEAADISIDDLVPRTARMIEEEGLIEDPEDIIQAVMGVGRQIEESPGLAGVERMLGDALEEAGFRRRPIKERAKMAKDVLSILQSPEDEAAKMRRASDLVRRYAAGVRGRP